MAGCICRRGWINLACPVHGVPDSGSDPLSRSEQQEINDTQGGQR